MTDGFATDSPVYLATQALLSQNPTAKKMNWLFAHLGDWISYIWEQLARVITANWFVAALPTGERLQGVAYSPTLDIFCAVGFQDGTDADIVTSSDGLTWSEESNAKIVRPQRRCLGRWPFRRSRGLRWQRCLHRNLA